MRLTLTQAAKEAGISKGTVSKALKAGRLSGERQEDGSFQIEPVELFRVFPRKPQETQAGTAQKPLGMPGERPETDLAAAVELAVLRTKLEAAEVQLAREREDRERERDMILERERETVGDLRKRLDQEQEERRNLQRQLAAPIQPPLQPVQEVPAVIDELRRRLEESEARNQALMGGSPPTPEGPEEPLGMVVELHKRRKEAQALVEALEEPSASQEAQERPEEVPAEVTPAGGIRGLLGRLLGR